MAERLEDLLRACTVRVTGGPMPGAGFFIAPNRVLTCVHVAGDSEPLRVLWERDGKPAIEMPVTRRELMLTGGGHPIPVLDRDYPDVAVVEVAGLDGHPCVLVDEDWPEPHDVFQVFGYPSEGDAVLLTPARLTYRGPHGTRPAVFLDLASDTIKPGMSGGALLNLRTGAVCGVVAATKHPARAEGALAVPWSAFSAGLGPVAAANRAFHAADPRWARLRRLTGGHEPASVPAPGQAVSPVRKRAEVVIEAAVAGGELRSSVWVAGSLLCQRQGPLPAEAVALPAPGLPPLAAGERLAATGRRLAGCLIDDDGQRMLAGLVSRLRPGDVAEVVLIADDAALHLPAELIRLAAGEGGEVAPLGLLPAVSVSRQIRTVGQADGLPWLKDEPAATAGPLKILAAVAAPDETRTPNAPLDVEAEMQAVLDAVTAVAGGDKAQVRILEVASVAAIREALDRDSYHVLHLSAHGSPEVVELEDEDGGPVEVSPQALISALQHGSRPVPLIVLASCSGGATGSRAMAAALVRQGGDRVVAMLAAVTDPYATTLARHLYRELAAHPRMTAGLALARARHRAEEERSALPASRQPAPEYGVATLLTASGDGLLIDPALALEPLSTATTPPTGRGVRELPLGTLIGRRPQLRAAMSVLRRTPGAVDKFGVSSGVILTGIGGIGKTALAGRIMSRLRDDGWLIAVHEGRWNPAELIGATARAVNDALRAGGSRQDDLRAALAYLTEADLDDQPKLGVVAGLLGGNRLLIVFDDFEQNLTTGGGAFADLAIGEVMAGLAGAAETGALLIASRYRLPGPELFLAEIRVPPLSAAELRRMFLRLPGLRDLDTTDRRTLISSIGGHPRLIEFTDAILRGGRASLRHIQVKLAALARDQGVDLAAAQSLNTAIDSAILLGSADILLTELRTLLTPRQDNIITQVSVSRAPMALDDLAFALSSVPDGEVLEPGDLSADVDRLRDLTLLTPGPDVAMHPWTADLVTRNTHDDLASRHEQALAMRLRRLQLDRAGYGDLTDIPRHLAALHRYDDIAAVAGQAATMLEGTLATVAYLAEIRPLIPPDQYSWLLVAELETQALLNMGDLGAATQLIQRMHEQVQARATSDPANSGWQRDLSVSHDRIGDVAVAAGDLAGARVSFQAGLDIRSRLAAADPGNSGWQRDLSVSHDRIGDVAVAAGDLAGARVSFQAGLDIAARLAAADPGNSGWQRDLSVSHDRIGDVAVAAGDLAAARASFQAGLDIRSRLAAADPGNAGWQRDLSVSHDRIGDVAVAAGELAAARASFQAGLDIRSRLAAADPGNSGWQRDLSVSHDRIGDVAVAAGDLAGARVSFQAGLDIRSRLAAADPGNSGWQRDLSVSHDRIGDVAVAAGDLAGARVSFQAGLDIAARLAAADPGNSGWQRDLSVSHEKIGDVAVAAGDLAAARASFQASLDIAARLAAADPGNAGWQRDLSVSHDRIGDVAVAAGDLAAARASFQASLDIAARLAAADPGNAGWQRDLSVSHDRIGDVAVAAGDLAGARASFQAGLDIRSRLAAADPGNSGWQRDLVEIRQRIEGLGSAATDTT